MVNAGMKEFTIPFPTDSSGSCRAGSPAEEEAARRFPDDPEARYGVGEAQPARTPWAPWMESA